VPATPPLNKLAASLSDIRERHRERHRPTGFGFVFADRIDYLDPAKWDAVTEGSSLFNQRHVLRVIEEHGPENIQPRYALLFRAHKPVAAVAAQIVRLTGHQFQRQGPAARERKRDRLLRHVLVPAKAAGSHLR